MLLTHFYMFDTSKLPTSEQLEFLETHKHFVQDWCWHNHVHDKMASRWYSDRGIIGKASATHISAFDFAEQYYSGCFFPRAENATEDRL